MTVRSAFCLLLLAVHALHAHAPSIGLTTKYLNFVAAPGGPNPAAQVVTLTNVTHGRMPWTATVNTTSGGNWLTVSPDRGTLPGIVEFETVNLSVSVNSSSLPAGVYYGTITIAAPGDSQVPPADNTPQVIEVGLAVTTSGQPAPGIVFAPALLGFEGVRGSGRTYTLTIQIGNVGAGTLNWTATAVTDSGGSWLSVSPAAGVNATLISVSASVGNLGIGTYSGRIELAAFGAPNSPRVPVTFRIRDPLPPMVQASTGSIRFEALADGVNPSPQNLGILNGGEGTFNWRVNAETFNGGPWLEASPLSGSGIGAVTVRAALAGLPPGSYAGRITITADGALNSPLRVPVAFEVRRPQPIFEDRGIVNAATFLPGPLVPGQIASIFGSGLGPVEGVAFTLDRETGRMPVSLGGTRILFDDVPAPLFYASFGQVNFQVPFEVAFKTSARMTVMVEGRDHAERGVTIAPANPGVFTVDGTRAAALNQDFTLNTPENPAAVGSVVQLYLTGQGILSSLVSTGTLAPSSPPFPEPALPVTVTIDGFDARVLFAGLAPGFVGLTQVNAEIPRGVFPSSNVRVNVAVGFFVAVKPVTIAVR